MSFDLMVSSLMVLLCQSLEDDRAVRDNYLAYVQIMETVDFRYRVRKLLRQGKAVPDTFGLLKHPRLFAFDLADFMASIRVLLASDQKDRAYGMFGVLEALGVRLPRTNYRLGPGKIYWDFTVHMLKHAKQLRVLQSAFSDTSTLDGVPTWVPDLRRSGPSSPSPAAADGSLATASRLLEATKNMATCNSAPRFRLLECDRVLETHGHVIDTVRVCSARTIRPCDAHLDGGLVPVLESGFRETVAALRDWFELSRDPAVVGRYGGEKAGRRAFCQTVCHGYASDLARINNFSTWLNVLQQHVVDDDDNPNGGSKGSNEETDPGYDAVATLASTTQPDIRALLDDPQSNTITQIPQWQILCALHVHPHTSVMQHIIFATCANRAFFTTADGRMGMGPRSARKGDAIMLLAGMDLPMVLRASGGSGSRYTVVGPAFVTGAMEGALWKGGHDEANTGVFELV